MTVSTPTAAKAAEQYLTLGETAQIVGCDRRAILAALNLESLRNRVIDGKTYVALSVALEFKRTLWSSIRHAAESSPRSHKDGGRQHGHA